MVSSTAFAAEIHSNGTGGGDWSNPASWHDKALPTPADTAVISSGDAMMFDRDDGDKVTCKELAIDPDGALVFKTGGKRVMVVSGTIESYGTIKMDTTKEAKDQMELRMVGDAPEKRAIKLMKGASVLLYGTPNLPDEKRNVILSCNPILPAGAPAQADPTAVLEGGAGTMIDLQHANILDVQIRALYIDNTGSKPNERINISDSKFIGQGRIYCNTCDTPTIVKNVFTYRGDAPLTTPAINVVSCPMAEIRGNQITGKYYYGIMGQSELQSTVERNSLSKCTSGIYWYGTQAILKNNDIHDCDTGIVVTSMDGTIEDTLIEGSKLGLNVAGATLQCTNLSITKPPKDGVLVDMGGGFLKLVNCDITPDKIKLSGPAGPTPRVQSMVFLIVSVHGTVPKGSTIEVATAKPAKPIPKGGVDLNISSSPATISPSGVTPFPRTHQALTVKSWTIEGDGKLTPPVEYLLSVVGPPPNPDADGAKIKTVSITPGPTWFRAKPDEPTPTVEVTLP